MQLAARNAIKFLSTRAGLTELDAYALCSIAVSFRVNPGSRYCARRARYDSQEPVLG